MIMIMTITVIPLLAKDARNLLPLYYIEDKNIQTTKIEIRTIRKHMVFT